jgi:leucyl-tRNA synthetase
MFYFILQEIMHYAPDLHNVTRDKLFYTLVMFPYPSGYGLHAGHASNFVINDVLARYKRLQWYTVFNPFGFDSFGLPTENYAMKLGKPAYEVTAENIVYFKSQTAALNLSFDTEREVVTSSPEYYKRTQWLFQQLYKAGLVYRDTLRVNRCPECQTVLANDQVVEGTCERCKSEIIQKKHPQWFIKITDYAEKLLNDLDLVDRPEETKTGQRNWIGRSEWAEIDFTLWEKTITVFTTRPDTVYGVTALVLAPENTFLDWLLWEEFKTQVEEYRQSTLAKTAVQRQKDLKEKTGVFSGLYATHPLTGEDVAIWYADYVLADYGTGAVMMVPAHDERDWEFAKKFGIENRQVIAQHYISGNAPVSWKETTIRHNVLCLLYNKQKTHVWCLEWKKNDRRSFVMWWVDGEDIIQAGKREIIEETWYTDLHYIEQIPGEIHAEYYAAHKDINRYSVEHCLVYQLNSDSNTGIKDGEENHDFVWIPIEEVDKFLSNFPWPMNSNLVFRKRYLSDNWAYTWMWKLINSSQFDWLDSLEAKTKIAEHLELIGKWRKKISYKLRDWSVSRQRYWGSPIPVYYDENNEPHLIPEEELPVLLPLDLENYKPTGKSPLEDHPTFPMYTKEWKTYHRECDTLDTFMCSSFYFLRYPDANNPNELCDPQLLNKCFPIDFYIWWKEHTVGHLLYARFINKFLYDQGYVSSPEPFQRLVHQGMVLGADGRKMSKRRWNIIDPMEVIEKYGADAVRTYLMFMGPVEQEKVWNDGALAWVNKFLGRIGKVAAQYVHEESNNIVERALHKAIKWLTDDMEALKYNTAVSKLMILLNTIEEQKTITKGQFEQFMILLFPFAPQTARTIWETGWNTTDIEYASWPTFDSTLLIDETISLPVQINGKVRANIMVAPDTDETTVLDVAQQDEQIQKYLTWQTIRKVIYVQWRILNIVI